MITFQEAKQIAIENLKGSVFVVSESQIAEKTFGWYFPIKSKSGELYVGSNGFIVDRENGHVFTLGSAYPPERDFAAYEAGFRYDFYDLTILTVRDIPKTVHLLLDLTMSYVIPEEEYGTVWKIPTLYSESQIQTALQSLPFTFKNQKFYFRYAKAVVKQ